jgi:NADH-quinone oxidoreductase subunit G
MLNYLNLFKEKNLSENFSEKNNLNFISEKMIVRDNDYYYSNAIARSSKTMFNCRKEKKIFKSTGTEG